MVSRDLVLAYHHPRAFELGESGSLQSHRAIHRALDRVDPGADPPRDTDVQNWIGYISDRRASYYLFLKNISSADFLSVGSTFSVARGKTFVRKTRL